MYKDFRFSFFKSSCSLIYSLIWRTSFFVCFLCVLCVLFFSCSDSDTQVMATSSQVVFDFDSEETTAVMRLCAFAQVEGNVNKVATVKVEHTQQGLYWYVTTPQAFENGQHKWAGYTNMVMPKGQDIMPGIYKIVYEDLQQEEGQSSFSVYYPKELVTATACDALKYMGSGYRVRIVLYDKNQTMIYCDTKRNQWYNTADILRDYPTALTYRYYYTASTGKYSCLMPIKSITQFE